MAKTQSVLTAVISATADGANTVVAAVTGKKIRVLGYVLNVNAAGTVQWKTAASANLSGLMEFVDGGGLVVPCCDPTGEVFWFETVAGEALTITTAAGVDALGHIVYQLI
jgi:hypothetical protein